MCDIVRCSHPYGSESVVVLPFSDRKVSAVLLTVALANDYGGAPGVSRGSIVNDSRR